MRCHGLLNSVDRALALRSITDVWQFVILRGCVDGGGHAVVLWPDRLLLRKADLLRRVVRVRASHRLS